MYTVDSNRRINLAQNIPIPQNNCDTSFIVVSGTLRHTEQHTKSWTKSENGKVNKSEV